MNMIHLAARNVLRQPKRTVYTTIAIVVAVAAMTFMDAYIRGFIESYFETFIRLDAGHVKLMPSTSVERSRPTPLDQGIQHLNEVVRIAESTEGITDVSPRIRFPVLLEKETGVIPAMGIAFIPSREENLMNLQSFIIEGRMPTDSTDEIMLGNRLAEELGLGVGDELFMLASDSYGGLGPGLYQVVGIVNTGIGMLDRRQFYVPLSAAQFQLAMDDMALEVVCKVASGLNGSFEAKERLRNSLASAGFTNVSAVPWQEQGFVYQSVQPVNFVRGLLMFLLGILAATTVINTILMSVIERTREIGALRAMGFTRGTVIKLILTEAFLIGLVATIIGVVIGMSVALFLAQTGIDYTKMASGMDNFDLPFRLVIYPDPNVMTAVKSAFFGLLIALGAAWYPARVAVRLQPVEALRHN